MSSVKDSPAVKTKSKKKKFDHKKKYGVKTKKKTLDEQEIDNLKKLYKEFDSSRVEKFADLPLSRRTQKGLKDAEYEEPTEIQRESIGLALRDHDILGAAKTGSGKTLAFLIPVLEKLFRCRWTSWDGLGALIITPTRELAYQIFEVLRSIGKSHDFSAGLVIGGKHLKEEASRINGTNIIICTPGRLLQHMDETINFNADNLQILVLDEADRILDLGFQKSMNAIIANLPKERQTLLFSATQTRSVKDLARLSLKDPMYVSVHEHSQYSTPTQLEQSYIVCELHEKLNVLWSFIKSHIKTKTLVFLSSCKQVRYVHEIFRRLRPGVTVLALHGAMQQLKRVNMYDQFCRKEFCVMFATDIAARGLDFPEVNWVIQYDCPEDANTYIHRAGRTARYKDGGEALLMLTPSEENAMMEQLQQKKIPINRIQVNAKKMWDLKPKLESLLASEVQLKEFAQRAFVSYIKSVFVMKNKSVFDVSKLNTDEFAYSLGLAIPPRIRFLQKEEKRKKEAEKQNDREGDAILKMFQATAKLHSQPQSDSDDNEDDGEGDIREEDGDEIEKKQEGCSNAADESKEESKSDDSSSEENQSDESEAESEEESEEESDEESGSEKSSSEEEEDDEVKGEKSGLFDVGDVDFDSLLTVKEKGDDESDSDIDKDEEPEKEMSELKEEKKSKALTKAKIAKKLLKKKISVNTKVIFDEAGEVLADKLKKPQVALKEEEEGYEGGINIEAAKQRMREEDRIDRRTQRERIRKMHMEKKAKLKAKARKQKKDEVQTEEAVLEVDDNEDGDDPLAFLPDPDKVYGEGDKDNDEKEEGGSEIKKAKYQDSDDGGSGDEQPQPKKRKLDKKKKKRKQTAKDGEEIMDTGLSLGDDEALALKLLQS